MTQLSLNLTAPTTTGRECKPPTRRSNRILTASVAVALTAATLLVLATVVGGLYA